MVKDENVKVEVKQVISNLKNIGVTKQDLLELKKLDPEELVNLQSAAQKNKIKLDADGKPVLDANGNPVKASDEDVKNRENEAKDQKSRERAEREQARKLNQLDDEARKTLQHEAMADLSTEELELLSSIDADLRNKLLKLDPKYLDLISADLEKTQR